LVVMHTPPSNRPPYPYHHFTPSQTQMPNIPHPHPPPHPHPLYSNSHNYNHNDSNNSNGNDLNNSSNSNNSGIANTNDNETLHRDIFTLEGTSPYPPTTLTSVHRPFEHTYHPHLPHPP